MLRTLPLAASIAVLLAGAGFAASAATADDPAPYLRALRQTCLTGFPDFDAVARGATVSGWQETTLTVRGDPKDLPKGLPRAFRKDGMMLFLTTIDSGPLQRVCQVAGTVPTKLSGADVAAIVSPDLNVGTPEPIRSRSEDSARWTIAPGVTVQAGIAIYGRMRTISLAVRQER